MPLVGELSAVVFVPTEAVNFLWCSSISVLIICQCSDDGVNLSSNVAGKIGTPSMNAKTFRGGGHGSLSVVGR